jgi:hypothetical protein
MNEHRRRGAALFSFLLLISPFTAIAQQAPSFQDDDLSPESFTNILKGEWTYLRDSIDQMNKRTAVRGEFETTSEFQVRTARERQGFLEKLNKHIRDNKMDSRIFGVLFKASLVSYNADAGVYAVQCAATVDAPYDIPTVVCFIPANPYVGLADSILGGYRTSKIYLKFDSVFNWTVGRKEAMNAKQNERNLSFKVHFAVDLSQNNFMNQAIIKIVPKDIALIDQADKHVYWRDVCSTSSASTQEDDRVNLRKLREAVSQFVPLVQGKFKCTVKKVSISTENVDRELVVTLLIRAKKDVIGLAVDEIRALGAKDQIEPNIPSNKKSAVMTLDKLIAGVFGFMCTRSKALNINTNTQTIILLDSRATPIHSISGNRQNVFEAGSSENYEQLFSLMTIKDL